VKAAGWVGFSAACVARGWSVERTSGAKSGLQEDNRRRSLPRPRCCPVGSDCSPLRCSARAPRCALLSWRLSNTLTAGFCVEALSEALARFGKPDVFNTDQGAQFTSDEFTNMLRDRRIEISMDGRGRCHDNIFVERLWWTVKHEEPEPQADGKRPSKQEKVIEMLRRPEGATVDEVVRATGWQRHTVRGVFLVRQSEEILNIGPQFASKVASASFADSMLASSGAITTTATSTGSPLLISPSLTNTFGPSSSITCTSANSTTAVLIFPVSVIIPSSSKAASSSATIAVCTAASQWYDRSISTMRRATREP
jgi:hypothetical protein